MITKIKNIKEKVKKLLIELPHLRDSDERLIATIWWGQLGNDIKRDMKAFELLTFFACGDLSNPEAIRRSRQKIMEQNPELQGKSYKARKQKAVEMKQQINSI